MPRSSSGKTPTEINVTLIDKAHVTMLALFFVVITYVSLYAQYQNQQRIEHAAIQRCQQRTKLEALVTHESIELEAIDARYFGRSFPDWVRTRRDSLNAYTKMRRMLGEEQCRDSR